MSRDEDMETWRSSTSHGQETGENRAARTEIWRPGGDPLYCRLMAPVMKGNIVRMIVAGTLELTVGFYIATAMSPFFTNAAIESGFALPENAVQITSISDGFLWPYWLFVNAVNLLGGPLGLLALAVLLGVTIFLFLKNTKRWEEIAGAPVVEE